jgi:hypothetical protein
VEVVALAVEVELMATVVVKLVVVVPVLVCLFESKVTKVDTEKDVMTVRGGVVELELVEVVDDDDDDLGGVRIANKQRMEQLPGQIQREGRGEW